jgi:Bacterial regulatory helix-turn-helix protein, lysR family
MDRLAAIESFVRIAETQSFSEAARRLGLSKSASAEALAGSRPNSVLGYSTAPPAR